jgi:tetratricopeptide (TPR) repeat protein
MPGYSTRDVSRTLGLSAGQIRAFVRAGVLDPERGRRGEHRFSFQDLVVLRTARELAAARIPPRQIHRTLRRLREQLPGGRPLAAVQIVAAGDRIVVRDGRSVWNPESGQALFDFDVADLAEEVAPVTRQVAARAREEARDYDAEAWYEMGYDLEPSSVEDARDAYRRALELDPDHVHARVNLGRLLHEAGLVEPAAAHYRIALACNPRDPTAAFNLGVALEDLGHLDDAVRAYEIATRLEADFADAHFNLARLYEKRGERAAALRHLKSYRLLTRAG